MRSFMGLKGYYRKFISGFSKIYHPITCLKRKDVKFEWTQKCEDSFKLVKRMLTGAAVLKIVDLDKYFMVCLDPYNIGLGGVLI